MQWFNWILRGGRRETLPELLIDTPWLRGAYPDEEEASRVICQLVAASPLTDHELRGMTGELIDEHFRELLESQTGTARWTDLPAGHIVRR